MSRRDLSITGNGSGLDFQVNNQGRPDEQSGASCQRLRNSVQMLRRFQEENENCLRQEATQIELPGSPSA
jgi:hypothetical protein